MTTENVFSGRTPEGTWHDVDPVDVPDEGRVRSVSVDGRTIALSLCHGSLGALDNRCPHQGGPLGEGSIEKGLLRCPWHGYDYDPLTGQPPGDFADSVPSYPVEEQEDGVRVLLPEQAAVGRPSPTSSWRPSSPMGSPRSSGWSVTRFAALSEHLPADAVVAVDVGNHAYSLGRYLESKGQPVLMSGYLGSIGFGYPAAMGVWAADLSRPVVAVTSDGGFGQYATELTTAVKYGMPIRHVLLNNNSLGKISKEQLAADYPVWHTSLHNPDWAGYADLCGATGIKVTDRHQLDEAMATLFATTGPTLLCVEQDPQLL